MCSAGHMATLHPFCESFTVTHSYTFVCVDKSSVLMTGNLLPLKLAYCYIIIFMQDQKHKSDTLNIFVTCVVNSFLDLPVLS